MNDDEIRHKIESVKETTVTCSNKLCCVDFLIEIRKVFFNLAKEQIVFIDIAENEYGIHFDDESCRKAAENCHHPAIAIDAEDERF